MKISDMSNDELAQELEDASKNFEDDVDEGECEEYAKPNLCKTRTHFKPDGCEICGCAEYEKRDAEKTDSKERETEGKIDKPTCHVIKNPCWLADRFVFKELHTNSIFGRVDTTVFITLNTKDKIEDVDCDISHRMHDCPLEEILKHSRTATETEAALLNSIDDEFWLMRYSHIKLRGER